MQYFFNTSPVIGQSSITPSDWFTARDGVARNLKVVQEYYYSRPHAVRSNHILARILTNIGVPYSLPLERFHSVVEARALSFSIGFKLTSSLYKGALFNGIFYGEGSTEVIIATDDSFDPFYAYHNWKTLQAVKVVYHPKSDLDMTLPNGKASGTEKGISVFSVNIPMLAVQFRAFMETQMRRTELFDLNPQTTAQFIHMYVLPNMLPSQTNLCLFNRAYNLTFGVPMGEATRSHPFALPNFNSRVDKSYAQIVSYLKENERDFRAILRSFGTLSGTFEDALRLPETVSTRQIVWTEVIARMAALRFMVELSPSAGRARNTMELNQFVRMFRYYENDRSLQHALPADVNADTQTAIREIIEKIKL